MKAEIEKTLTSGLTAKVVHKNGVDFITHDTVIFDDNGVMEKYNSRWGSLVYLRIIELSSSAYFEVLRRGLKKYLQMACGRRILYMDKDVALLVSFLSHVR